MYFKSDEYLESLAGGDTSQGSQPWAVSPPPTAPNAKQQFEMHPPNDTRSVLAFILLCLLKQFSF